MKNYTGIRKEMKEAGWNRRDRAKGANVSVEYWIRPGSDHYYTFLGACRRFKKDKELDNGKAANEDHSKGEKVS